MTLSKWKCKLFDRGRRVVREAELSFPGPPAPDGVVLGERVFMLIGIYDGVAEYSEMDVARVEVVGEPSA